MPLLSLDGKQLNTISYSKRIRAFLNMQANLEKQSHMVCRIFSNKLRKVLDATGRGERLLLEKQGREGEQAGRSSGP